MFTSASHNAVEAKALMGPPQLTLSDVLLSRGIEERRRELRRVLYGADLQQSPDVEESNSTDANSSHRSLIVHRGMLNDKLGKKRSLPTDSSKDIIDWNADTWRQRRENAEAQKGSSSSALTTTARTVKTSEPTSTLQAAKWKISKILVGHQGWVWTAAVDPTNSWFASGGFDGIIKIWDITTGALKLNLTGHKEAVRSISMGITSPYMFTGSDDHSIKCWDLERNEVIREFFGHRSAVHTVAVHPVLDVVVSGGRDTTVRVWDIRTRKAVHTLTGHQDSVMSLATRTMDPQIISGGSDGFIYMWDLGAGKAMHRMTRHKKPVRGLALSPSGSQLVSCGADEIRVWELPSGSFECNASTVVRQRGKAEKESMEGEELSYLWSACAMSARGTLAVGSQDGHVMFYDWNHEQEMSRLEPRPFFQTKTKSLEGTLQGEGGINCMVYDASGTRLVTAESDKTVKIWQEKKKKSSSSTD